MNTWKTVYEMDEKNPNKCLRVWRRKWYAGSGDGYISHDGEVLEAEGYAAQNIYDDEMEANEKSAE
jgi:hypothetical protein